MVDPVFGFTFTRDDDEPRAVIASDLSTIAFTGTAPDADVDAFPLNTAVLVRTSDSVLRAKLGATGTLPDALRGVAGQLEGFQAAADVVVVRVTQGSDAFATIGNIIGSEENYTGMWALLLAGPDLAKIPRLLGFPGYTHQRINAVTAIAVAAQGANYTSAPAVAITGGGGTGATAVAVLGTGATAGKVVAINVTNPGSGYTSAPAIALTGGAGAGATAQATVSQLANGVCAAAPAILERLVGHAVVEGPGTNETDIKNWRETFTSQRLIPIDMWVKVQEGASVVTRPGAPRVLGLGARVDYQNDGAPMHSWANQPIQDIVGFVRNPTFSLLDGATEGQSLLAANIGIGVRGELGVESAIADSGFIFIGTDNAADDTLWQFYNVTRGRDYIHLGLIRTLRSYLGRNNINAQVVDAFMDTVEIWLSQLQSGGHILGYRKSFDADKNLPESLRLGRFAFSFAAEEPPVLRRFDITSRRYRPALEALVQDLLSQMEPTSTLETA